MQPQKNYQQVEEPRWAKRAKGVQPPHESPSTRVRPKTLSLNVSSVKKRGTEVKTLAESKNSSASSQRDDKQKELKLKDTIQAGAECLLIPIME